MFKKKLKNFVEVKMTENKDLLFQMKTKLPFILIK